MRACIASAIAAHYLSMMALGSDPGEPTMTGYASRTTLSCGGSIISLSLSSPLLGHLWMARTIIERLIRAA